MATLSKSELKKMQSNYNHMLQSPIVQKLNKKVSKLKKENRILNRLLLHLGDQPNCRPPCTRTPRGGADRYFRGTYNSAIPGADCGALDAV